MNPLQALPRYVPHIILLLSNYACAEDLATSVYMQTRSGDPIEVSTSFVVLAHLALPPTFMEQAEQDYRTEKDSHKRYYYEYLLAARTQQKSDIQRFSRHSCAHFDDLLENRTSWISVSSPYYQALSYYALTEPDALECMLKLVDQADGATAEELSSDLRRILRLSPDYFRQAATRAGFSERNIHLLRSEAE